LAKDEPNIFDLVEAKRIIAIQIVKNKIKKFENARNFFVRRPRAKIQNLRLKSLGVTFKAKRYLSNGQNFSEKSQAS